LRSDLASTYNSKPWQVKISQQVADALQQRKDWLGAQWVDSDAEPGTGSIKLLDYACGTGAVTKALGGYVNTIRGIDISENMVSHFNEAARSSGLSQEQANAVVGDLLGATVPAELQAPEYYDFDVAAIGLGFHHFEDPPLALIRLAERLKPATGVLIIVDFLPFDHMADMQSTIKYNGFTANGIKRIFEAAGFEDFGFEVVPEPVIMELKDGTKKRTLFVAKGRRTPTVWGKLMKWVNSVQDAVGMQMVPQSGQPGFNPMAPRANGT